MKIHTLKTELVLIERQEWQCVLVDGQRMNFKQRVAIDFCVKLGKTFTGIKCFNEHTVMTVYFLQKFTNDLSDLKVIVKRLITMKSLKTEMSEVNIQTVRDFIKKTRNFPWD